MFGGEEVRDGLEDLVSGDLAVLVPKCHKLT
jgi:hypothetical protein